MGAHFLYPPQAKEMSGPALTWPTCILKMKVEILSEEHIRPSSLTPSNLTDFKISFIDERIPPSYIPLILYYTFNEDKNINQSEMCRELKSSLSDALVDFYPLAGRMKGQILVDCNDEGALYVEAYANGMISSILKSPDSAILDKLVPFITNGNVSTSVQLLAIQITSFSCGGIAMGICISHRIADGCTLSSFIKYWAAMSSNDHTNMVSPHLFNSSTLFPPRNTPDFRPNLSSLSVQPLPINIVTKRFVFTPSAINALKLQATENSSTVEPTRVEVLTAFLWSRCVVAKGVENANKKSVAYHPVNLRGKMPSLTENSFGNIFQMASVESDGGETGWVELVDKLRAAFGEVDSVYVEKLLGEDGFELAKENFRAISKFLEVGNVEVFRFTSFCRFPIYEADFGWGKPALVSSGSYRNKDSVFLFDSVEWGGGIEAWVVMSDHHMERLKQDVELRHFTSHHFAS